MSARISQMYKRSGGCNTEHKCGECKHFASTGIGDEHICKRQGNDDNWDSTWLSCKQFEERNGDIEVITEEHKPTDEIVVDPGLSTLMPPLEKEEFDGLEKLIIKEGCKVPLDVWEHEGKLVLVDGHNRYKICRKHNKSFDINKHCFKDKSQVILWMIDTQCGRRNLKPYDRTIIALKYEEVLSEEAEKNLHLSKGRGVKKEAIRGEASQNTKQVNGEKPPQNSAEVKTQEVTKSKNTDDAVKSKKKEAAARETRERVAKIAGVSRDTVAKVKEIEKKATPKTKELVRAGQLSINQAFNSVHPKKPKADIVAEARKEHEEFQQKKTERKVDFAEVKTDKKNQRIINKALMEDVLKLFDSISKFGMTHKTTELSKLKEIAKEDEKSFIKFQCKQCREILNIIEESI